MELTPSVHIFQFHKGTIKTQDRVLGFVPRYNFNSIKVRLKLVIMPVMVLVCICYFNSIKVRLKQNLAAGAAAGSAFQFHKGTIKTKFYGFIYHVSIGFQFHKGTIKTYFYV